MGVFSGKDDGNLDIISEYGVKAETVEALYDELCSPKIGELKFVSQFEPLTNKGIVLQDEVWKWQGTVMFDGWVYPDGSKFSKNDFPAAYEEYGDKDASLDFFTVPNLTDSFFSGSDSPISDKEQKTGLTKHNHTITDKNGISAGITLKNGFVFCAATNNGSARVQTYYTHPATIDIDGNPITGYNIGTMQPVNPDDPNYPPSGIGMDEWSIPYTVPAMHAGTNKYNKPSNPITAANTLPMPIDMQFDQRQIAGLFEYGETDGLTYIEPHDAPPGSFKPESVSIPVMIYIGKKKPDTTKCVLLLTASPSDGGDVYGQGVYKKGSSININAVASVGHNFSRWSDGYEQSHNVIVNEFTSLTAYFTKIDYTVTFDGNGGEPGIQYKTVAYGNRIGELPTAENGEYNFDGWYTAPDSGISITENTVITGDTVYYAHWGLDDVLVTNFDEPITTVLDNKFKINNQPKKDNHLQ